MNSYTHITAEKTIKCPPKNAAELLGIPQANMQKRLSITQDESGMTFEYNSETEELYIFGDQYGDMDEMTPATLEKIGNIIRNNNLPYLEFGIAYTADSHGPNSHDGTRCRITNTGKLIYPKLVWPETNHPPVDHQFHILKTVVHTWEDILKAGGNVVGYSTIMNASVVEGTVPADFQSSEITDDVETKLGFIAASNQDLARKIPTTPKTRAGFLDYLKQSSRIYYDAAFENTVALFESKFGNLTENDLAELEQALDITQNPIHNPPAIEKNTKFLKLKKYQHQLAAQKRTSQNQDPH